MDFAAEIFKMAGALVTVLALMMGGMVVLKRQMGMDQQGSSSSGLRMLGGLRLGPGKSIVLVEVAGEVLVLGATAKALTLLTRVENPDRVERLLPIQGRTLGRVALWPKWSWFGQANNSTPAEEASGYVSR